MAKLRIKNIFKKKKIKVIFLAQYIQGIDKFYDVVMEMKTNELIDVKVLALPDKYKNFPKNDEFSFWKSQFKEITINAIQDNKWFDLKEEEPDYIFIQRPYDDYLPEEYYLSKLSEIAKLCYIPYGYTLHTKNSLTLNDYTLKNLYIYFAENLDNQRYAEKVFNGFQDDKKRISVCLGYPSLDKMIKNSENKTAYKYIKNRKQKIIYTPRWETGILYGTSFFKYKNKIIKYLEESEVEFIFRPHPLMFENLINKGLLKKEEKKEYLNKLDELNAVYDFQSEYFDTFKESDVLITDFSSIIVEYLILNKPIIYLESDDSKYNKEMKGLVKTFYCAKNWSEVKRILNKLKDGNDPLKSKREKEIKRIKSINDGIVCEKIVDYIINDYKR